MTVNLSTIAGANETLARRRQITASILLKHQQEVYAAVPQIEDIGYQITALGAEYTMANLAKQPQKAQEIRNKMLLLQEERKALLISNYFSPEYLEPIYFCQKCKDKGFVNGKVCSCLQQEMAKQRQNSLSALSPSPDTGFESFSLDYYPNEVWENNINPRNHMENVFNFCKDFANNFDLNCKSLLMFGTAGLGKTHLSCAIAKECMNKGYIVMYASSQSLFGQIDQAKSESASIVNDIISCDLFILDDLGTEYMTPHGLSVLYNIINTRIIKGLPCIYSTNLTSHKAIVAKYGEKVASRILGSCENLYFVGKDIRLLSK